MSTRDFEIMGDTLEELRQAQLEDFIDEVNWAFAEAEETNTGYIS